jgi:hypothetical protein
MAQRFRYRGRLRHQHNVAAFLPASVPPALDAMTVRLEPLPQLIGPRIKNTGCLAFVKYRRGYILRQPALNGVSR